MISKHKLLALMTAGTIAGASFLGIQTLYTPGVAAESVALRTPTVQSAEFFEGGYESTSSLAKQTATAIPLASSTTGSLQSSLENESAERKTQDEKISKSIGSINNTLLGYIGSSSISNIGDGTLRGAIGNTSIAGIGSSNNITSAISGLNSKIGSTNISTGTNKIGDGTLTGAVSSLNSDITDVNNSICTIGSFYADSVSTRLAANSWSTGASLTLPPGKYVILHRGMNTNDALRVGTSSGNGNWCQSIGPMCSVEYVQVVNIKTNTVFNNWIFSPSSVSSVINSISAVRIM